MKNLLGYKYLIETKRSKTGKIALYLFYRNNGAHQRTDLMLLKVPDCDGIIVKSESGPVLIETIFDQYPEWRDDCYQRMTGMPFHYKIAEE